MTPFRHRLALCLLASLPLLGSGCVSAEDKQLIQTMSAVGQGNLREWKTLTDEQRLEAHQVMVNAAVVLDRNVNGAE
jgi:hypothetical protein